jgi:hypothetical protein
MMGGFATVNMVFVIQSVLQTQCPVRLEAKDARFSSW